MQTDEQRIKDLMVETETLKQKLVQREHETMCMKEKFHSMTAALESKVVMLSEKTMMLEIQLEEKNKIIDDLKAQLNKGGNAKED